jgi:hypothetical protein
MTVSCAISVGATTGGGPVYRKHSQYVRCDIADIDS